MDFRVSLLNFRVYLEIFREKKYISIEFSRIFSDFSRKSEGTALPRGDLEAPSVKSTKSTPVFASAASRFSAPTSQRSFEEGILAYQEVS